MQAVQQRASTEASGTKKRAGASRRKGQAGTRGAGKRTAAPFGAGPPSEPK